MPAGESQYIVSVIVKAFDQASKALASTTKGLGGLETRLKAGRQVQQDFNAKWGETIQVSRQVGIGMVATGAAITGVLAKATSDYASFSKGMAEVSTLVDTQTVSMGKLEMGVRKMATQTGASAADLTKALYQTISAGVDAGESIEFLGVAAKTAVGGVTDTATAVDGMTTAMNAWGRSAADATDIADSMFTAMKAGKTTIGELSQAYAYIAGTAASAGLSFDETNAALAAMTTQGMKTDMAARSLNMALISLIRPTDKVRSLARGMGVELGQAALAEKGLVGVMAELEQATGGNVEVLGQLVGGSEAARAALALMGAGGEKFADTLDAMADKTGAAAEAYKKMAREMAGARLKALIQEIGFAIGEVLLPIAETAAMALRPLMSAFAWLARTPIGKVFIVAGAAVGAFMLALGPLLIALPSLVSGYNLLKIAVTAETVALVKNTLAQKANVAARLLGIGGRGAVAARGAQLVLPGMAGAGAGIGAAGGIGAVTGVATAAWAGITTAITAAGTVIAGVLGGITIATVGWVALIVAAVAAIGYGAYQLIKNWEGVKEFFAGLWDAIGKVFSSGGEVVVAVMGSMWEGVSAAFGAGVEKALGSLSVLWAKITEFASDWPRRLGQAAGEAANAMLTALAHVTFFFTDLLPLAVKGAIEWLKALPERTKQFVVAAGEALKEHLNQIEQWAKGAYNNIVGFIKELPTTLRRAFQDMWSAATEFFAGLIGAAQKAVGAVVNWFRVLPATIADVFRDMWSKVSATVAGWLQWIANLPAAVFDYGKKTAIAFLDGFRNAFRPAAYRDKLDELRDHMPRHSDARLGPLSDLTRAGELFASTFFAGIDSGFAQRGGLLPIGALAGRGRAGGYQGGRGMLTIRFEGEGPLTQAMADQANEQIRQAVQQ